MSSKHQVAGASPAEGTMDDFRIKHIPKDQFLIRVDSVVDNIAYCTIIDELTLEEYEGCTTLDQFPKTAIVVNGSYFTLKNNQIIYREKRDLSIEEKNRLDKLLNDAFGE